MATVRIIIYTGSDHFEVELDRPETNMQAWGVDKSHLDRLLDQAVARIRTTYSPVETS